MLLYALCFFLPVWSVRAVEHPKRQHERRELSVGKGHDDSCNGRSGLVRSKNSWLDESLKRETEIGTVAHADRILFLAFLVSLLVVSPSLPSYLLFRLSLPLYPFALSFEGVFRILREQKTHRPTSHQ